MENVWRASIAQGIFEGLLFGMAFALIFTKGMVLFTKAWCSFQFVLKHILAMLGASYVCWACGGLAAIGLVALSPEFYRETFPITPDQPDLMYRFAWVGGSIWGAEIGGLMSVIIGLFLLRANRHLQLLHHDDNRSSLTNRPHSGEAVGE